MFVNLQLEGTCLAEQDERRSLITPGSITVFDTTRPYQMEYRETDSREMWKVLSFRIPRELWNPDAVTGTSIDTTTGAGALVGSMMSVLWKESSTLDPGALATLDRSFIDVLTAVAGSTTTTRDSETRDNATRMMLRHYIRTALPSGRVSADAAAREAMISTRTMHRLLNAAGTTFSECVRHERMNGAIRDILTADPAVTLGEIAARWGFYDSSHLTRTFRRQFDCTPMEYRARHRDGGPRTPS